MKISVLKITIVVLSASLALLAGCGKRNRTGSMAPAPSGGGATQDFSSLAYNPTPAGQNVLMSDYILLSPIAGNKDNKRVYAQMSLFFIKAKAADQTKKHQYQFFYREFVTCQDGPTPNTENTNVSYLATQSGEAILVRGGGLNATNLGSARMFTSKTKHGATLTLGQKTHGTNSPTTVILNFKATKAPPATLEDYQAIKNPNDPDMSKAINKINCTNAGAANLAPTIPYGPPLPVVTPPQKGASDLDSAELIQDNDEISDKPVTQAQDS